MESKLMNTEANYTEIKTFLEERGYAWESHPDSVRLTITKSLHARLINETVGVLEYEESWRRSGEPRFVMAHALTDWLQTKLGEKYAELIDTERTWTSWGYKVVGQFKQARQFIEQLKGMGWDDKLK